MGGLIPRGFITVTFTSCDVADSDNKPARKTTLTANQPDRFFILFLPFNVRRLIILQNDGKLHYTEIPADLRFKPGRQFAAIPIHRLPAILDTLKEVQWDLPGYQPDGTIYIKRLSEKSGL